MMKLLIILFVTSTAFSGIEDRKYLELPVADVTDQMISDCIQTSRKTLIKSLDRSMTILKWESKKDPPRSVADYLKLHPTKLEKTKTEIHTRMQISNWKDRITKEP